MWCLIYGRGFGLAADMAGWLPPAALQLRCCPGAAGTHGCSQAAFKQ